MMTGVRPRKRRKPDFSGWEFSDVAEAIGNAIAGKVAETLCADIANQFRTIWIEPDGPHLWLFDHDGRKPYRFALAKMRFEYGWHPVADVDVAISVIESWLTELRKIKTAKAEE